jgi:glycosidase
MWYRYPKNMSLSQLNLLDSHDVARFKSICNDAKPCYELSLIFLFLAPGVPCLFYGDELGVEGIKEDEYRKPMPWELEGSELQQFVKKLISVRREFLAFDDELVIKENDENPMVVTLERRGSKGSVLVYLNTGKDSIKIDLPESKKIIIEHNVTQNEIATYGYGIYRVSTID